MMGKLSETQQKSRRNKKNFVLIDEKSSDGF